MKKGEMDKINGCVIGVQCGLNPVLRPKCIYYEEQDGRCKHSDPGLEDICKSMAAIINIAKTNMDEEEPKRRRTRRSKDEIASQKPAEGTTRTDGKPKRKYIRRAKPGRPPGNKPMKSPAEADAAIRDMEKKQREARGQEG